MSQENVELVRRLFDAVARSDAEEVLAFYDTEVEWDATRSPMGRVTGGGVFHGHEGIRAAWQLSPSQRWRGCLDAGGS